MIGLSNKQKRPSQYRKAPQITNKSNLSSTHCSPPKNQIIEKATQKISPQQRAQNSKNSSHEIFIFDGSFVYNQLNSNNIEQNINQNDIINKLQRQIEKLENIHQINQQKINIFDKEREFHLQKIKGLQQVVEKIKLQLLAKEDEIQILEKQIDDMRQQIKINHLINEDIKIFKEDKIKNKKQITAQNHQSDNKLFISFDEIAQMMDQFKTMFLQSQNEVFDEFKQQPSFNFEEIQLILQKLILKQINKTSTSQDNFQTIVQLLYQNAISIHKNSLNHFLQTCKNLECKIIDQSSEIKQLKEKINETVKNEQNEPSKNAKIEIKSQKKLNQCDEMEIETLQRKLQLKIKLAQRSVEEQKYQILEDCLYEIDGYFWKLEEDIIKNFEWKQIQSQRQHWVLDQEIIRFEANLPNIDGQVVTTDNQINALNKTNQNLLLLIAKIQKKIDSLWITLGEFDYISHNTDLNEIRTGIQQAFDMFYAQI